MRFQILVDRGERLNKCTILPLAGHPELDIVRYHRGRPIPALAGQLLLHPEGTALNDLGTNERQVATLSAIDCTWKRLGSVLRLIAQPLPRLVKIPDGFQTAYPRRNKLNQDPDSGLATIEAVFIAAAFLGHWNVSLLGKYPFATEFLELNRDSFARYGAPQPVKA